MVETLDTSSEQSLTYESASRTVSNNLDSGDFGSNSQRLSSSVGRREQSLVHEFLFKACSKLVLAFEIAATFDLLIV